VRAVRPAPEEIRDLARRVEATRTRIRGLSASRVEPAIWTPRAVPA